MEISDVLRHPATLASAVTSTIVGAVSTVAQIPILPELITWASTNAFGMFSGMSVLAFRVVPEIEGQLPPGVAETIRWAGIALALVVGVLRLLGPLRNLKERLSDS